MSLLLDALNRASKEKQKAAAAALPPAAPVEPLQWEAVTPAPEASPTPHSAQPVSPPTVNVAAMAPAPALELELALEPAPAATAQSLAPTAPVPASVPAPAPVTLSVAAVDPSYVPPPPAPQAVAPVAAPVIALALESVPAPSAATAAPPRTAPTLTFKPVPEGQMAQDIRRAYEPLSDPSQGGRRRMLALGGLAVGLALAIGSVFLGLWGDLAQIMGLSGQSSVAMSSNSAATGGVSVAPTPEPEPELASADAPAKAPVVTVAAPSLVPSPTLSPPPIPASKAGPVAAPVKPNQSPLASSEKPASVVGKPTSPSVPRAPSTLGSPATPNVAPVPASASAPAPAVPISATPPNNEVVLRGNATTKPAFVAKTRGPGALEQGYAALLDGRLNEAAQAYGQALRANADERDALLGMAYINHQNGRREDAQAYYRKVLRQEPGNAVAIAGLQSLESGTDSTLSAGRASELATRQPDSAAAMAMAGNALVRDGSLADAAQAFARAQALEPSNPLHAYNHAVALDRLGQHAAALAQYDKVLDLSATVPAAVRAYQVEAVRLRVAQLRHALATAAPVKP